MSGLGLADLFDLESLVLKEKGESEEARRSRYRDRGRLLDQGIPPEDAGALLQSLIPRDLSSPTPGTRFEAALGWFHSFLALSGLLCGAVISLGLLHYTGDHPVNVLNVLAALVGVQLVLLLLLVIALIPRNRKRVPGLVQEFLLRGLQRFMTRVMPGSDPHLLKDLVRRLDAHMGLTRWLLVRAAQIFGVSFNLAALAGCLYRIVFSDVAFGWSTTLHFNATTFHGIAEALSSPWAWIFPHEVPSQQMVELTQYSHLEGKYLLRAAGDRSLNPWIVGGWWPFLILSIGTYGLLPRLIVLALSGLRIRRILRETPGRNEEFRRMAEWMKLPVVSTRADSPISSPTAAPEGRSGPDPELPPPGASCDILLDGSLDPGRDFLDRLVQDRFGWTISDVLAPKDLDRIQGTPDRPLLAVFSAWEEPTKGRQRLLRGLPKNRLIVIGLLNPSANGSQDPRLERIRERWKRQLQRDLGDLRLRVESLERRP
jgi:hypothetical protein